MSDSQKPYSDHWADVCAHRLVRQRGPGKLPGQPFVCAAGITPSGTVHIGNFREIISVELVVRALRSIAAPVRFIYSWDDYDVFRRVPANMPQAERLQGYLRQPITRVPDLQGNADSYAQANEAELEAVLPLLGIQPEYIYQAQRYQASTYAQGLRTALAKRQLLRQQLNAHRSQPLPEDWWPIAIFCANCHRDQTHCTHWDENWCVHYRCQHCQHTQAIDLRHSGLAKLPWRIDWPMRWAYEQVDFEPAGKDHHSEGGSFSTAKETCQAVYDYPPPESFQYDFVRLKGLGGKMSSSSGQVLSLAEVLEVYPAEIVRYLFASTRPNAEFAISFDLDVLKVYDDFIRCEQAYYQDLPKDGGGKAAKKQARLRRIYELSQVATAPAQQPFSLPLRHLCNLLQVYAGDSQAVQRFLQQEGAPVPAHSEQRFATWTACAKNWLAKYAPEEFRFVLRRPGQPLLPDFAPSATFLRFLPQLRQHLQRQFSAETLDREALSQGFYQLMQQAQLQSSQVFPQLYQLLIGRNDGPRLLGFLEAVCAAVGLEDLLLLLQTPPAGGGAPAPCILRGN